MYQFFDNQFQTLFFFNIECCCLRVDQLCYTENSSYCSLHNYHSKPFVLFFGLLGSLAFVFVICPCERENFVVDLLGSVHII